MDIKMNSYALERLVFSIIALIAIFPVAPNAFGAESDVRDYTYLVGRVYVRTNTWNGCVRFAGFPGTSFHEWKCTPADCATAVNAARHFVRYGLACEPPVSYFETEVPSENGAVEVGTNEIKSVRTVRLNINQFEPLAQGELGIGGREVHKMGVRVLPFVVTNPNSKAAMYCVLVAFFEEADFVVATYFNWNTGKVVLDFHDISEGGWMLIAEESRYPYLLPSECAKQSAIVARYNNPKLHKREEANPKPIQQSPDIKVAVPDL